LFRLGRSDEQGESPTGNQETTGDGEGRGEALDGAQSDGGGRRAGVGFGAARDYIDIGQCSGATDFTQKYCFLLVRFDEGDEEMGGPDLYGYSGEASTGTEVDHGGGFKAGVGEEMAGGEQGLAEVASDDLPGIADGGEVDAGVPAQK